MNNIGQVPQAFPDASNYGSWCGSRRWDTEEEMAQDFAEEAYLMAEAMMTMRGLIE